MSTHHTPTDTAWSLRTEWGLMKPLTEDELETLHDEISPVWHACISTTGRRISFQASCDAPTLAEAVRRMTGDLEDLLLGLGHPAALLVIDALTQDESDRQQREAAAQQEIPDLYWPVDIARELGIEPKDVWALLESEEWKKHTTPVMSLRSGPLYTPSQIAAYKAATGQ